MEQEESLADMAAFYRGVGITDLVFYTCSTQAFARNLSLSAVGGAACERLCGMDCGANRYNLSISQSREPFAEVAVCAGCDLRCNSRHHRMEFALCNQQQAG